MISVIIQDKGEANVIKLTYQNLWKELKDIEDAELLVSTDWLTPTTKNTYVCFVEADCLVNSGYFASQIGLFKKNPMFRKLAMLSASIGVNNWANKFYGYELGENYAEGILPVRDKHSSQVYPVQIGYVPGSIMRKKMLGEALKSEGINSTKDMNLVELSTRLSLAFWQQGDGNRVHINPNASYVTTEDYVNDIGKFDSKVGQNLVDMFKKESI